MLLNGCHRLLASGAIVIALYLAASFALAQPGDPMLTVETVNGESLARGMVVSVNLSEITFSAGAPLPLDDVRLIRISTDSPSAAAASAVVHLAGGGRLPVQAAVLVNDACRATLPGGRDITLLLDDVTAIQWTQTEDPAWISAVDKPSAEFDLIVVQAMPQATTIRAFVESISSENIEFDWEKQTRTIARSQVIGVVLARPDANARPAKLILESRGGARIPVVDLRNSKTGQDFRFQMPGGSEAEIPTSEITAIRVRSSRVSYLSDRQPVDVRERPIVALPRAWQADRNVRGEPLQAGTQEYELGIGVQSGTSLTYELDGTAEQFVAMLALDPPSGRPGDCEFVISADDRELARHRLKDGDLPVAVRLPLAGARRLELRVEYGENLDFGDHANWCDAHLVLSAPRESSQ